MKNGDRNRVKNNDNPAPTPGPVDLADEVKGMFRLLDLISESGSNGYVDKVIIAQDSLQQLHQRDFPRGLCIHHQSRFQDTRSVHNRASRYIRTAKMRSCINRSGIVRAAEPGLWDLEAGELGRVFKFEVPKTYEQEESAVSRPGFQLNSRIIVSYRLVRGP
ncbi:hypothetical protein EDB85DRAFT_1403300 [Lactarius pseudohatsudake]|nr:hypothetical protein EDB85DRAFT_1403300 [Lactarius pseudohatsudake]